jgi:hypothetical protein
MAKLSDPAMSAKVIQQGFDVVPMPLDGLVPGASMIA